MTLKGSSPRSSSSVGVAEAVQSASFWLILAGSTLVIGAIGAVIQHFILFLKDAGYSATVAARFSTTLLAASLGGRVIVGYLADRFRKTHIMTFFLFSDWSIGILSRKRAVIYCLVDFRDHFWIFDGC